MSTAIFNRADFEHPADGWYQIEPKGIHHNREAGVDQVIDDPACSAIVNRFNADADAGKLPQGSELLIDHEHFKDQHDQETIAYGWLQRLQSRADGIYGKIRWTAVSLVRNTSRKTWLLWAEARRAFAPFGWTVSR
jgi:phage I-like protein